MFFGDGWLIISPSKDISSQLALFPTEVGSQGDTKLQQSPRYTAPCSPGYNAFIGKFKFILHLGRIEQFRASESGLEAQHLDLALPHSNVWSPRSALRFISSVEKGIAVDDLEALLPPFIFSRTWDFTQTEWTKSSKTAPQKRKPKGW